MKTGGRLPSPAGEERGCRLEPPLLTLSVGEKGEKEEQVKPIRVLFIPQGAIMQAAVQINVGIYTNELHNLKNLQ